MSKYKFKITYRNENKYGQYWGDNRYTVSIIAETIEQAKQKLDEIEKNDYDMHKNILTWEAEEIPSKIKISGYEYRQSNGQFWCDETEMYLIDNCTSICHLNDEIEIIEEDKKDKEIEIYVNGEKVDITDIYEPLKQGEYFYKENGKWYAHRLKNVTSEVEEDKKIEKLNKQIDITKFANEYKEVAQCLTNFSNKINEIIDVINEGDK